MMISDVAGTSMSMVRALAISIGRPGEGAGDAEFVEVGGELLRSG